VKDKFDPAPRAKRWRRLPRAAALVGGAGEAGITREGFTIPNVAREHLLHEHIRGLNADADDTREQALVVGRFRQAFGTVCLDFLDLLLDEAKAVHVAPKFGQRVCCALRGA
jgi:hypothetical protein